MEMEKEFPPRKGKKKKPYCDYICPRAVSEEGKISTEYTITARYTSLQSRICSYSNGSMYGVYMCVVRRDWREGRNLAHGYGAAPGGVQIRVLKVSAGFPPLGFFC